MENKIYFGIQGFLEDHNCKNWREFRSFVDFATDGISDVGYIGGNPDTEIFTEENLEDKNGIFFITENETSPILYFPFTFEEFNDALDTLKVFKN